MADGRTFPTPTHGLSRPCLDPDCGCRAVSLGRGGPTVLEEAASLTSGDREKAYGHPRENFGRIASMWEAYLGVPVSGRQVAMCMVLVKVARDAHQPKRDNLVDVAGYARTAERLGEA